MEEVEAAGSWIREYPELERPTRVSKDQLLGMAMGCLPILLLGLHPRPYLRKVAELPGSLSGLLWLVPHFAAQYFILHLSEMYISLLRALLE